jgi:hypothetical protein
MSGWYRRFGATSRFYVRQTTTQTSHCNDLHQTSPCSLLCFVSGKSRVQVPTGTQTTLTTLVPLTQHNTTGPHRFTPHPSNTKTQIGQLSQYSDQAIVVPLLAQGEDSGHLDHLPRGLSSHSLKLHNHLHVIRYDTPRITTCTTQSFFMAQKTVLSQLNP